MANKQINAYTAASTIDAANDVFLIDPAGTGAYKKITRNTIMGVTGTPADISSTQTFTNKTIGSTNTITVKAANLTIQDGTDTTKQANFVASSITTATTRNVTFPDANTTLPIATQVVTIAGPTAARTYTFPDAATTVVGTTTTQTLTNKTITDSGSVLGGVTMTVGSDASGDVYYRNSSGILTRVASVGAQNTVLTMGASNVPSWATSTSQVTLLKANSGTDTSAGATNVDTYAISGLTAKDSLLMVFSYDSITQATANVTIYSSTDGTVIATTNAGNAVSAGNTLAGQVTIRQAQRAAGGYDSIMMNGQAATAGGTGSTGRIDMGTITTATAWTGSWTIALRHGGVTAGGTFRWSYALYKIAGQ